MIPVARSLIQTALYSLPGCLTMKEAQPKAMPNKAALMDPTIPPLMEHSPAPPALKAGVSKVKDILAEKCPTPEAATPALHVPVPIRSLR